jgi:hypothetical protein
MKKKFLVAVAASLLIGCGGGGGGSSPAPAPANPEIKGTYRLTGFTVVLANGTTITEKSSIAQPWSGSMEIGPTTIRQSIMLAGVTYSGSWSYTVEWTTSTTGFIHASTNSVKFTMVGGNLTTDYKDADGEEWDYWVKVSDSYTIKAPEVEELGADKNGGYIWMAELLK